MEEMIKRHRYLLNESLKGKEKEYNLRYLLAKKDKNDGRTTKLKYAPENPWQCPFESSQANFVKNISTFLAMYLKGGN